MNTGESGVSKKYDDYGDSFKLGVLVIPRSLWILMILANIMDLVILVILMNQVILVMTVILLNLTGKNANSKFVEGEMKSSIHFKKMWFSKSIVCEFNMYAVDIW